MDDGWQQMDDERRRREDEALTRSGALLKDFRRERAVFERETNDFNERMKESFRGNHGS